RTNGDLQVGPGTQSVNWPSKRAPCNDYLPAIPFLQKGRLAMGNFISILLCAYKQQRKHRRPEEQKRAHRRTLSPPEMLEKRSLNAALVDAFMISETFVE